MPDSPTIHVNEAVDRLSKLVLDEYVETDETIGPRVREFEQSEQQLQMLGQQITAMRDAASSQFEAHTQLIELALTQAGVERQPLPPWQQSILEWGKLIFSTLVLMSAKNITKVQHSLRCD